MKVLRVLLLFYVMSLASIVFAHKKDTIFTVYNDGEFVTHGLIAVDASKSTCMTMVDDLISQFRGDPDQLFEWAFKGLGKQEGEKNEKNEVLIQLKQALFDNETQVGTLIMDIIVPGLTRYKDVRIESLVKQKDLTPSLSEVSVDIFYSNALLKKAYGTFFVEDYNEKTYLSINIHIKFGWFFNLFITKRRFENLVEWRADGFLNNLRHEAELRETNNGGK
jgi:hypothetical protein